MITCKECEAAGFPNTFKAITHRHLKYSHDMTMDEYIAKWPEAPLRSTQLVVDDLPPEVDETCQTVISHLRPVQQEYIAARLQCKTKDAAARMVGLSPTTIYNWKERNIIEALVNRIQTDHVFKAMHMVLEAAPNAIQNIRDLQYSPDDRVALSASKDLADRAGIQAGKSETTIDISIYKEMSTEQLDREISRMIEQEEVLEAQYREIDSGSDNQ